MTSLEEQAYIGPIAPDLLAVQATYSLGASTDPDQPEEEEVESMEFYTTLFATMIFFFVMAGVMERYKPRCGHQTSFTIIFGVIIALFLWWGFGINRAEIYSFKQDFFFDFLLPPIILNSGFNMRRKKFF